MLGDRGDGRAEQRRVTGAVLVPGAAARAADLVLVLDVAHERVLGRPATAAIAGVRCSMAPWLQ